MFTNTSMYIPFFCLNTKLAHKLNSHSIYFYLYSCHRLWRVRQLFLVIVEKVSTPASDNFNHYNHSRIV